MELLDVNFNTIANQLVSLSNKGVFNKNITAKDTDNFPTHKSLNDITATLNDRARSYLDLNCSYCHRPGTGNRAEFDLRLFNSLEETGLFTAGSLTPLGIEGERIIVPGNAEKSILYHRMISIETTMMMPPLAKGVVDKDAAVMIRDWINQLQSSAN